MQVHRSVEKLPSFKNAVITIGSFDGVHLGHRKIIDAMRLEASRVQGETVIVSFEPHPRKVVQPHMPLQLITTLAEKIALLQAAGIDHLVVVPFTKDFSDQPAGEYIETFLIQNFHPAAIIIGYDHHFGKNREGNYKLLEEKAADFGYRLIEISQQVLNEISVSSTKIRNAILSSDVATANSLLGYAYFFEGEVVHGDKLGRTIGFPTANLVYTDADKIHLGHGVYAVRVKLGNKEMLGMMSIGTRPTLNKSEEKVEVNLFDFADEIYGERLQVSVVQFLRGQEKYSSLEAMVDQLHRDQQASLSLL